MARRPLPESPVPRLALRVEEVAAALGVSYDFARDRVLPELHAVRRGSLVLYPVAEVQRWLAENAHALFEEVVG